jgi:hypothetical protein
VAIPALFIEDVIVTDLTSIGTLFAFTLVAGGVLLLPRVEKQPGRFSLPHWNGQYTIPLIVAGFVAAFNKRITDAVVNISHDSYQEILFLVFVGVAVVLALMSYLKKFSFIPIMGVLFCLYLMVEIPANSWLVFFGWMVVGLLIYFGYGYKNSNLKNRQ